MIEGDAAIARSEIKDDIVGSYGREPQHLVDHHQRCPDIGDLLAGHPSTSRGRYQEYRER